MLRVAKDHTAAALAAADVAALRSRFARHHWVRLPGILDPDLLADVQARLDRAEFVERVHHGVTPPSIDLCMVPNPAAALLEMVFNDPSIFRLIERVTGCPRIGRFGGFVYRLQPGFGHHHHWHDDLVEGRLVAMSVNLGPGVYEGGLLELRDRSTAQVLDRVSNIVPGDALLFRLDAALQHRATPVTSGVKTAFAGWYFAGESYPAHLRALTAP